MIETVLQIENGAYPFDEDVTGAAIIKVQDIQSFTSLRILQEKRSQMQAKAKLLDSAYLIRLLKVYQQDLNLHYLYEFVPYSLKGYISKTYLIGKQQIANMNIRLFLKKISSELMMLISYLVRMKIEVQLSIDNIGFTKDEKLKLFMNSRCKMGRKTELTLIAFYNQCKQKIIQFIQQQFENKYQNIAPNQEQPPNFQIKGNRLVFPTVPLNQSMLGGEDSFMRQSEGYSVPNSCESGIFNSNLFENNRKASTASCINQPQQDKFDRTAFLRQTQSPKYGRSMNFSQAKYSTRSSRKPQKAHKNSFQFGNTTPRNDRFSTTNNNYEDKDDDAKSFTHSRSIRIQFEQKLDPNQKKKRKDSYKVKVTSFHEYEMDDCDPRQLFGKNPERNQDIFQFFTKKAQNFNKQKNNTEQQEPYDDNDDAFSEPPLFMRKESNNNDNAYAATTVSSARNLQEKVRLAKEKASNVLNRYMKAKKMSSMGQ